MSNQSLAHLHMVGEVILNINLLIATAHLPWTSFTETPPNIACPYIMQCNSQQPIHLEK